MISNTAPLPMLTGSTITVESVKRQNDIRYRKTKVVCTLGPACWEVSQLEELIDAGMNIARLNFSHGDHDGHGKCLERLRTACENRDARVAVMLDTKGPEIRTGFFSNNQSKIQLIKGEQITLTTDYSYKGDNTKLACSYSSLPTSVTPGQSILVADGSLVLSVLSCNVDAGEVQCRIENDAMIGERKNMNLPGVVVDLPTLTEKDVNDIVEFGVKQEVDFIAASFVRKASDVQQIRQVLSESKWSGRSGQSIKIISKIENLEGLQNFQSILRHTDAIMVARGDLGMEIPPEKVFLAQKYMIREANIAGKPVITATQMLESMISHPRPTRAECSDVANAVLDGTDAVMLSGETANGSYYKEAVEVMVRTCVEAESSLRFNGLYQAVRNSVMERYRFSDTESLASSAVKTAIDIQAKVIVVLSESGTTARLVSKFRPGMPVAVLTLDERVARQVFGIDRGCHSFVVGSLEVVEELVVECANELRVRGVAQEGDPYVVVCGKNLERGATDQVQVRYVASNYWDEVGESQMTAHNIGRDGDNIKPCSIM